jgi:hypothetical protein
MMTNGPISTFDHPAWTAKILFVTGGLAIGLGTRLFFLPVLRYIGVNVPVLYRYLLAVLAFTQGILH